MIFSDLTQCFFCLEKSYFGLPCPFTIFSASNCLLVLMFCCEDSVYTFNSFVVNLLLKQQLLLLNNYITVYNMLISISNV